MSRPLDLTGQRFGRLVAIERATNSKSGKAKWLCKCDCGNETMVFSTSLVRGLSRSCGCLNREVTSDRFSTHRLSKSRLHETWSGMKKRCYNSNSKSFAAYGGRGIEVCSEWRDDFQSFYNWAMSNGYADNLSIDRIDVNGNYCPENCRWVDKLTQANNCRTNHYLTFNSKTQSIAEWSRELGVSDSLIRQRLLNLGWSVEQALTTPVVKATRNVVRPTAKTVVTSRRMPDEPERQKIRSARGGR